MINFVRVKLTTRSGYSWTTDINKESSDQEIVDYFLNKKFDVNSDVSNEIREKVCGVEIFRGEHPNQSNQYCSQEFFIEKDQMEFALKEAATTYDLVHVKLFWHSKTEEDIVTINNDIFVVNGKEFGCQLGDLIDCRYGKTKRIEFFVMDSGKMKLIFSHEW